MAAYTYDQYLANHAAPTLLGLKVANYFHVPKAVNFFLNFQRWRDLAKSQALSIRVLTSSAKSYSVLLYDEA